ncbi:hypothetical protein GCM10007940_14100 [Portibacter lacus]|uniref:Uncharacterized protein n=1 Tax=Portibacter lacus TaxID=1099794 RepID=A0AA37SND5_9BACT|nr:hypothetical protein GCM10007940_14100 [Portibacter lacus]
MATATEACQTDTSGMNKLIKTAPANNGPAICTVELMIKLTIEKYFWTIRPYLLLKYSGTVLILFLRYIGAIKTAKTIRTSEATHSYDDDETPYKYASAVRPSMVNVEILEARIENPIIGQFKLLPAKYNCSGLGFLLLTEYPIVPTKTKKSSMIK